MIKESGILNHLKAYHWTKDTFTDHYLEDCYNSGLARDDYPTIEAMLLEWHEDYIHLDRDYIDYSLTYTYHSHPHITEVIYDKVLDEILLEDSLVFEYIGEKHES